MQSIDLIETYTYGTSKGLIKNEIFLIAFDDMIPDIHLKWKT